MPIYPGSGCFFFFFYNFYFLLLFFFYLDSLGDMIPKLTWDCFCFLVKWLELHQRWFVDDLIVEKKTFGNLTQTYLVKTTFVDLDAVPIDKKNVDLQLFSAVIKTTFVYSFNQGWNTTQLHRDNKKSPSFWTPSTNRVLWLWIKSCNQHHWGYFPPPPQKKTNMTMEHPPSEDVFPIEHWYFPMSC